MYHFDLPYGKGSLPLDLPKNRVSGVLTSGLDHYTPEFSPEELVDRALENPIGSRPLWELCQGKENITIICSDHTRPVPSKLIIPPMLRQIRKGNPDAKVVLLIATGCHRLTTREELVDKFGEEVVDNERIVIHQCHETEHMRLLGILPSGGECWVNKYACEADLLLSEGFIEPHFFAGYSGGRKSVLPGVAGKTTVLANHCSEFIADPAARAGSLKGNPIHRDMLWAAQQAGLKFIVNVVLNGHKQVIHAVAGDLSQAHEAGCNFLEGLCGARCVSAPIAITTNGGYPLDQNIYQAVKGMTAAEAVVHPGGVIIMASSCIDGHGGESFYQEMIAGDDMNALMANILSRGRNETHADQWEAQILIRILQKARVIMVSQAPDQLIRDMHMIPAHSMEEALAMAERMVGQDNAPITVIPDGVGVVVLPEAK